MQTDGSRKQVYQEVKHLVYYFQGQNGIQSADIIIQWEKSVGSSSNNIPQEEPITSKKHQRPST